MVAATEPEVEVLLNSLGAAMKAKTLLSQRGLGASFQTGCSDKHRACGAYEEA